MLMIRLGHHFHNVALGSFYSFWPTRWLRIFAPVPLLSLLKHPLAAGGMDLTDFRSLLRSVELMALRGHRPAPGLSGLIERLEERPDLAAFVRDHVCAPLHDLMDIWKNGVPSLAGLASALATAGERLAAREMLADGTCDADDGALHLWRDFDGEAAAEVMRDLAEQTTDIGINPAEFPQILSQLFAEKPVGRRWPPSSPPCCAGSGGSSYAKRRPSHPWWFQRGQLAAKTRSGPLDEC